MNDELQGDTRDSLDGMEEPKIVKYGPFTELAFRARIAFNHYMHESSGIDHKVLENFNSLARHLKSGAANAMKNSPMNIFRDHQVDCSDPFSSGLSEMLTAFETYGREAAVAVQYAKSQMRSTMMVSAGNLSERDAVNLIDDKFREALKIDDIAIVEPFARVDRAHFVSVIPLEDLLTMKEPDPSDEKAMGEYKRGIVQLGRQLAGMGYKENDGGKTVTATKPYMQHPLPIGKDQTCSTPFIVFMYNFLQDRFSKGPKNILELGTGCGYHLAATGMQNPDARITSVEYHESFSKGARSVLKEHYPDIEEHVNFLVGNAANPEVVKQMSANAPFGYVYVAFDFRDDEAVKPLLQMLDDKGVLIAPINNQLRVYYRQDNKIYQACLADVGFKDVIKEKVERT